MDLAQAFNGFVQGLVNLLPQSPFLSVTNWLSSVSSTFLGLRWLAWFFPVAEALTLIASWLTAVSLYYILSVIMRWVRVIQ